MSLQDTLLTILNFMPPILVGFYVFKKMKVRYARPLEKSTDLRVYAITLLAASLTLVATTALIFICIAAFYGI